MYIHSMKQTGVVRGKKCSHLKWNEPICEIEAVTVTYIHRRLFNYYIHNAHTSCFLTQLYITHDLAQLVDKNT